MQSRRALFKSVLNLGKPSEAAPLPVRPPYGVAESLFHTHCVTCEASCVGACEEAIIFLGEDKTPQLRFDKSGCTFCEACALACEPGVLSLEEGAKAIKAKIELDIHRCVSWKETMCFSCKDPCTENAIFFHGVFRPIIEMEKCTRCGLCISTCPTEAIKIIAIPQEEVV